MKAKTTKKVLAALLACLVTLGAVGCKNDKGASGGSSASIVSSTENSQMSSAAASSATEESPQSSDAPSSVSSKLPEESSAPSEASQPDSSSDENTGLWANADYTEDAQIGEGANTVLIEVQIEGKSITFTVKSDKDNLAEILTESGIAEGEDGAYGLYIKKVNGVRADYDLDKAYWALNKDGEATPSGASDITIKDGEHYELVYTPA